MVLRGPVEIPRALAWISLVFTGLVVAVGTSWAFQRGGQDFGVFHHAWRLVLEGRGAEIYTNSPDRFLYAPGFAWLLSPLGYFPRDLGLAVWCFGKAAIVGFVVREVGRRLNVDGISGLAIGSMGVALLARPILIDFQYGQVNILILGACLWAVLTHFHRAEATVWDGLPWFVLGLLAIAKVFALPLLAIPWLLPAVSRRKLAIERIGVALGLAVTIFVPAWTLGLEGNEALLRSWIDALQAKGLPLETHNQSFAAAVIRVFSGETTHVIFKGPENVSLGWAFLSPMQLKLVSLAWTFTWLGVIAAWLLAAPAKWPALSWISILIALLILPAHLVWKPYFIMGLPIAILCVRHAINEWSDGRWLYLVMLGVLFFGINFSGFDFLPDDFAAHLEGASLLLWMHLGLLALSSRWRPLVS
jgi:hypothetical protein